MRIDELLKQSVLQHGDNVAVCDEYQAVNYQQLDAIIDNLVRLLLEKGVSKGDRIGIWLYKSVHFVAFMQAVLRVGACYVPLDPRDESERINTIIADCAISLLVCHCKLAGELQIVASTPRIFVPEPMDVQGLVEFTQSLSELPDATPPISGDIQSNDQQSADKQGNDNAFILYTSGSTGTPKGVCISHRNALAFITWAASATGVTASDRLASHAPFHFDLSVFDLYVSFLTGAQVHLIPESMAFIPEKLVDFVAQQQITVLYCVPSILIMMMSSGELLERQLPALKTLVYAGEPFPLKQLRTLFDAWHQQVAFFNFYGPTETNVCTSYKIEQITDDMSAIPIGSAASGNRVWAADENGNEVQPGEEGELLVAGPTVMLGYWGREPHGDAPYATGDIVKRIDEDHYLYVGRKDHMVKIRGVRIELGEIESALLQTEAIKQAVACVVGKGLEAKLVAFVVADTKVTLLQVKRLMAQKLPRHMMLNKLVQCSEFPVTKNGKVDRKQLLTRLNPS